MVQAARSGVQNIAERSQASATSKKTELKLTNVARASLKELRLDYEDFLRRRELQKWEPDHPAFKRFKAKRCSSWRMCGPGWRKNKITRTRKSSQGDKSTRTNKDKHGLTRKKNKSQVSVAVGANPCRSLSESTLVANAVLSRFELVLLLA